ncbi:MAG: DUF4097 family beta strand repeat-containing protein [Pyrinomonadaceae bacterium]
MNAKFSLLIFLLTVLAFENIVAQEKQISVALTQERRVEQDNTIAVGKGFGNVTITGWERDTLEATAKNASSAEQVSVKIIESAKKITILLGAKIGDNQNGKIYLELKVPRYAKFEPIQTESDTIAVSDIEGFVNVKTASGDIKIVNVGSVQARTGNGNISLENIKGPIDLITGNGNINAQQIQGDTRIISVNAKINLSCVKGRVEISDTSSQIRLIAIEGDVDVSTSNGKAYFIGAIRSEKRYRLKTLSGVVSMAIPENVGFTATLSSYSGKIEKDFIFQNDSAFRSGKTDRRFIGKYGDGKAQIELDSFDGRVSFSKIAADAIRNCESETENKNE